MASGTMMSIATSPFPRHVPGFSSGTKPASASARASRGSGASRSGASTMSASVVVAATAMSASPVCR